MRVVGPPPLRRLRAVRLYEYSANSLSSIMKNLST